MLIHEGDQRTPATDLMLASSLALVAGGVNSAGYMAYHYFSANMTGNVSIASELLAVGRFEIALTFLTVVGMFILGAFVASVLIEIGKRKGRDNIYALTLAVEAAILIAVGLGASLSPVSPNPVFMVGVLSMTMGIQNAASSRISGSRVRTTHVSGVATDLGVGLAVLTGKVPASERAAIRLRLKLYLATIVCFAIGGMFGVLGYEYLGAASFSVFAAPLLFLSGWYVARSSGTPGH